MLSHARLPSAMKLIYNLLCFGEGCNDFITDLRTTNRLAEHSPSDISSVWAATSYTASPCSSGRPNHYLIHSNPTHLVGRKRKTVRENQHYWDDFTFFAGLRGAPGAAVLPLDGKMAVGAEQWVTDQAGEAEVAAGEKGEGAGSDLTERGWGWGRATDHWK